MKNTETKGRGKARKLALADRIAAEDEKNRKAHKQVFMACGESMDITI